MLFSYTKETIWNLDNTTRHCERFQTKQKNEMILSNCPWLCNSGQFYDSCLPLLFYTFTNLDKKRKTTRQMHVKDMNFIKTFTFTNLYSLTLTRKTSWAPINLIWEGEGEVGADSTVRADPLPTLPVEGQKAWSLGWGPWWVPYQPGLWRWREGVVWCIKFHMERRGYRMGWGRDRTGWGECGSPTNLTWGGEGSGRVVDLPGEDRFRGFPLQTWPEQGAEHYPFSYFVHSQKKFTVHCLVHFFPSFCDSHH